MRFGINFDYLCPFARNANEAVLNGIDQGRTWEPTYWAFSLAQVHLDDEAPAVWDRPEGRSGVLALQWGITVRDEFPEAFPAVHRALFALRHDHGRDLNDERVVREAVAGTGVDTDAVGEAVATGRALKTLAVEHTGAVERWRVFGVPSFLTERDATFVRFMSRGDVDDLARMLDLLDWTDLNEFKRTVVPR